MKPTVIFMAGPTSSGKTRVAIELAEAVNGEVISCDSMQVYKGMNILTRTPPEEELSRVEHHLIGIISPEEEYSAAMFVEESRKNIGDIISREKMPIFAGGTGLYVKSLIDGLFASPPKDQDLRDEFIRLAGEKGNGYVYDILRKVDSASAAKLHPNDLKRVIRALEVYELTGDTINDKRGESRGIREEYNCRVFALDVPREKLYGRIGASVDEMFSLGLVEEVKALLDRELGMTAGKAIGVEEVSVYLNDEISLDEAKSEMKKNTRRYAKRQLTWLRGMDGVEWVDADRPVEEIVEEIEWKIKEKGKSKK